MRLDEIKKLVRPGDFAVVGTLLFLTILSFPFFWQGGIAEKAIIRQNGHVFSTESLQKTKEIVVPGPLGETHIRIEKGRARVMKDPGRRQYCVRQGWLSNPGEIAICAPNRVSLSIEGRTRRYDTLNY